jgi:hypothetical protein
MIYVGAAQAFEAVYESGITGLVGTVEVSIVDNDGVTVVGPTTLNITENIVGGSPTGVYTWNAPAAPGTDGQYSILWSYDGSFDPKTVSTEDLVVVPDSAGVLPPIPPPDDGGLAVGPCTAWTTSSDALACCGVDVGTDFSALDDHVVAASEVLFALSGRLFAGLCSKTVRPCRTNCGCGIQVLSRGHVIAPWHWLGNSWGCDDDPCGCAPLSRVLLSGYPVREVTQVKIDGDVVDPDTYRLDNHRWLVRVRDPADPTTVLSWPSCQALDLPDTEDGTFSVTYTYGQNPPAVGVQAANALACQLYQACLGGAGDCEIPANAVRVTRQGVTIDKSATIAWFYGKSDVSGWATGIPAVDVFLNAFAVAGMQQRPRTWSPDAHRYAKKLGV